jgi:hypothetical protein
MKIASFWHARLNQLVKLSGHTEYSFLSADKSQSNCSRTHGHHIFSKRYKPITHWGSVRYQKNENLKTREEYSDKTDKIPS